jgi:sugar lactone lactonase YvrE
MMQFLIIYILYYSSSLAFAKISPCAKWNQTGITIVGTGVPGNTSEQLNDPTGIFIHKQTNILYVADYMNKRIQMFQLDDLSKQGNTVASFDMYPFKVYVDDDINGTNFYVSFPLSDRVEKWVNGTSSGVQIGDQCLSCSGVWVDKEKNVYMAESKRFRVLRWSPEANNSVVVAGRTDMNGSSADHLSWPDGIAVDESNGAVYVADYLNNRIQKWSKDAEQGITVAGSSMGTEGTDAATLSRPSDVLIDEETKTVYVVDRNNERIQRWLVDATSGDTIVGGSGTHKIGFLNEFSFRRFENILRISFFILNNRQGQFIRSIQ